MSEEREKGLVPRLRFPELKNSGEWEEKTIEEFAPLQRGFDLPVDNINAGDYPVVFSNGILKYHDVYKVKAPGIVTGRSGTIGKVTYVNRDFWPHNTSLWVTDFYGNKALFVFYYFVLIGLEKFSTGSGVPTLNRNDVHRHTVFVPKPEEQQKIADCLSSLDELIAAHTDKLTALKAHKKGLMQQLFPAEGETVPKLRFKEFEGSGDWEEAIFDDVAIFLKGKGVSKAECKKEGQLPCIRYGEIYTHYKEVISSTISFIDTPVNDLILSEANDVIIPSSGETQEDIATASCVTISGIALGGDLNIIRSYINGVFLAYYLNYAKKSAIAMLAQGNAVVHLYSSQLKKLKINFPKTKIEQQRIADTFISLDDLITIQTEKIAALKSHKKGLMQGLFPAVNE